jgi:hypothetical protein
VRFLSGVSIIYRMSEVIAAVEEAVAEAESAAPAELPSLREWVATETVRTLEGGLDPGSGPVTFEYLWYRVTVFPPGEVVVELD